jgi:hypothetical protein
VVSPGGRGSISYPVSTLSLTNRTQKKKKRKERSSNREAPLRHFGTRVGQFGTASPPDFTLLPSSARRTRGPRHTTTYQAFFWGRRWIGLPMAVWAFEHIFWRICIRAASLKPTQGAHHLFHGDMKNWAYHQSDTNMGHVGWNIMPVFWGVRLPFLGFLNGRKVIDTVLSRQKAVYSANTNNNSFE